MGLEPTTFSLATRRSTTELCPLVLFVLKLLAFSKLSKRQNDYIKSNVKPNLYTYFFNTIFNNYGIY